MYCIFIQKGSQLLMKKIIYKMGKVLSIKSIRVKLVSAYIIPIAFIILLGIVSYKKASQGMIENYESSSIVSIEMMGEYYEFGLKNISSKAVDLAQDEAIRGYYSRLYEKNPAEEAKQQSKTERTINRLESGDEFISNIFVFGNYGQPFSTVSTDKELKRGFYDEFNESGDAVGIYDTSESQIWKGSHPFLDSKFPENKLDYCLTYIQKMVNSVFNPIGYIVMDIDNSFVVDILEKTNFGENSITGFITNDGKSLLSGNYIDGFDLTKETFYQNALTGEKKIHSEYVVFNNQDYFFIYSKLSSGNATVFTLIPRTEIIRQAEDVKLLTIIIVILSCILALVVGIIISNGIGRVINSTNETLSLISTGDLTTKLNIKRKDEFNILGKSINDMILSMRSLIEKMIGVSSSTAASANDVTGASEIFLESSKSIASAVTDIEQGVSQQASDAENCLLSMADLAKQINMVENSTARISKISNDTKGIVKDGLLVIDDLSNKSKDTTNITQLVIDNIERLEAESESIISIMSAMNEITEQTKLLSLNATIEAARVGVAGRGFAVVAEEIRKLSDKSSMESHRISEVIKRIQERTRKTVDAAKKAEGIVATQEGALQDTMEMFDNINLHVENLADNLLMISSGINKISNAKNDTLTAIESISATLEETVAASTEVSNTAENQLSSVEQLNNAALHLSNEANNLKETIRVFKIR